MIDFKPAGVIYDIDDTLLDNRLEGGDNLHQRSRLEAVHTVGQKYNIKQLTDLTPEDNLEAFLNASVHTVDGAVWSILFSQRLVDGAEIDYKHPLLIEIADLKNDLHQHVLEELGKEVPGAGDFVRGLDARGLLGKQAIASMAVKRDVMTFLRMADLETVFDESRIITKEDVKHPKPHPEAFNLAFNRLNLPESDRQKVCAFEDDPRGIMAAKAAGLFVCAITTRFSKQVLQGSTVAPDLIADSYEEFSDWFGKVL